MKFEYGGHYKDYDMSGDIEIGTGIVRAHDIFQMLPHFMKKADCIFVDPPCSNGNLKSFYTKNEQILRNSYTDFLMRLFECIDEISPHTLFFEVFKQNKKIVETFIKSKFPHFKEFNNFYDGRRDRKCWILVGSNQEIKIDLEDIDQHDAIEKICKEADFNCIGDLCMGRGTLGFYANKYKRPFVGTELNYKRLANLLKSIEKGGIV